MFQGKIKTALRLITEQNVGNVLQLDSNVSGGVGTVRDALLSKHLPGRPASISALYNATIEPPDVHPVVFEAIDATTIKTAALRTDGAARPSGIDARGWRRLCASFHSDLCHSLALLALFGPSSTLWPSLLPICQSRWSQCTSCLSANCSGQKPRSPSNWSRRDFSAYHRQGSAVCNWEGDIQEAAGSIQLCSGQTSGIEAAVHAMKQAYQDDAIEAVLLVDAKLLFLYSIQ